MDRKEAIEILKKNYPHVSSSGTQFESALRELIPELCESEDERIRESLVDYFRKFKPQDMWDEMFSIGDVISYLEKQKEPQSLRDGEIEDRKRDIVAALRKYYPIDYAEYLTSFLRGLSPEDNSADEYGQKMLGIAYKLMYEHIPESLRTKEFWYSLKFMREYTGKVAIIHSYEKPAEWSKEDERNLYNIIEAIKYSYDVSEGSGGLRLINWLKYRLRPQPHWKPSEDEERLVNTSISFLKDFADKGYENAVECIDWLKSKINGTSTNAK